MASSHIILPSSSSFSLSLSYTLSVMQLKDIQVLLLLLLLLFFPSFPSCCCSHAECKDLLPPLAFRRRYARSRALAGVVGKPLPGVSGEVSFRALDFDISLDLFLMVTT